MDATATLGEIPLPWGTEDAAVFDQALAEAKAAAEAWRVTADRLDLDGPGEMYLA